MEIVFSGGWVTQLTHQASSFEGIMFSVYLVSQKLQMQLWLKGLMWGSWKLFKLLGLTLSCDLFWESHISKLASKARCRLGILHHAKSFLGTPELLSSCMAFIHSFMEYCSPLWAGSPASHLAQLDTVETKTFKIIGISCAGAEYVGLSLCHHRKVGGLRLLPPPFWSCALCFVPPPPGFCAAYTVHHQPLLVKLPISRINTSTHLFLFFPVCETNFHILFNLVLPYRSSRQLFTAISNCPQSKTMTFSTLVNPIQIPPNFPVFPPWSVLLHACVFCVLFLSVTSWSIQSTCSSMSLDYVYKK